MTSARCSRASRAGSAFSDITERKRAEERVRNSEQRLAQIIDFLPDPTWVVDCNGVVATWNRAMEVLTGRPATDMVGKGDYEYSLAFYDERRPVLIDLIRMWKPELAEKYLSLKKDGDILRSESHHPGLGDGGLYLSGTAGLLCDAAGNPAGAIEALRDITDRKQMEEQLRQAQEAAEAASKAKGRCSCPPGRLVSRSGQEAVTLCLPGGDEGIRFRSSWSEKGLQPAGG